ncbi:lytic murein transglycosylase [Citreicella sp. C3M06]|uniref:lytic murein transglycosylase n=1 Tax=Citreicella sp. C3M06 TaxID=2841564 RepID=UPI001C0959AC|nr:lytic murein transglycosylase [Citreicella sp. C3M06]MBU2959364.1 lytic murein transglycosylase [Citreicella sp. C3M06]
MQVTRRMALLSGGAMALLAGCGGGANIAPMGGGTIDPDLLPQPNPGWNAWVANFRSRAMAEGISGATLDAAFRGAGYLPGVVTRDRSQTEFTRSLEDYFAIAASETKVATGRAMLSRHGALLREIEMRYGVPAQVVTAIWGMESNYGARRGDIPVVSSTSTLAFDGRRGAFFEKQLIAALGIIQRGDVPASRLTGSWAGAMGHTQFIPTTFQAYAVDFRGDGHRDIWSDDPTDGLASTAHYLSKSGWRMGEPWGLEVRLPAGFSAAQTGRGTTRSDWGTMGVTAASGGRLPSLSGSILAPAGIGGPAFLVFRNFGAILRYNNAEKYGLGVGHLSDRIAGAGPLRGTFPPDQYGFTKDDRVELQTLLSRRGFDLGTPDGVFGSKTEAAVSAYQAREGLAVTGQPSRALLERLRRG